MGCYRNGQIRLKFTPLEFETGSFLDGARVVCTLKFTPLEFETNSMHLKRCAADLLKFTPLEFETKFGTSNYRLGNAS